MEYGPGSVYERIKIELLILKDPCFRRLCNGFCLKNGCVEVFRLSVLKIQNGSSQSCNDRPHSIRYQQVLTPNIFNGYGTTETFWNTFLRPFDLPDNAGTAGASCVDDDVRVVRLHDGQRTEPDDLAAQDGVEIGEVILSSPAKSPYLYYDNESETDRKYYKGFATT